MGYEFEMKYAASKEQLDGIHAEFPGEYHVLRMETTYYDTEDHAFSAKHYSLRRRMENDISVCNLKIPLDHQRRGEWECEDADIASGAKRLAEMSEVTELIELAARPLVATCGAKFTRQALIIQYQSCTVELALDQGILIGGTRTAPISEVEVELKSGDEESAIAFAAQLASKFHLQEENRSKFARAKALAIQD